MDLCNRRWRKSSPAVANGIVYAGSNDNILYVLDADTGVERWRHKTGGPVSFQPGGRG